MDQSDNLKLLRMLLKKAEVRHQPNPVPGSGNQGKGGNLSQQSTVISLTLTLNISNTEQSPLLDQLLTAYDLLRHTSDNHSVRLKSPASKGSSYGIRQHLNQQTNNCTSTSTSNFHTGASTAANDLRDSFIDEAASGPRGLRKRARIEEILSDEDWRNVAATSSDNQDIPSMSNKGTQKRMKSTVESSSVFNGDLTAESDDDDSSQALKVCASDFVKLPSDEDDTICSICIVDLVEASIKCKHVYCQMCLLKLREARKPCPQYKRAFRTWRVIIF